MKRTFSSMNPVKDFQMESESIKKRPFITLKRTKSTLNILGEDPRDPLTHPIKIKKCLPKKYFKLAKSNIFEFEIDFFAKNNFDINTKDPSSGWTLLHYAIIHKNLNVITELLLCGADLNRKSSIFPKLLTPQEFGIKVLEVDLLAVLNEDIDDIIY